jgi:hypothetical protein
MIYVVNVAVIGLSETPEDGAPHPAGTVIEGDKVEKIADAEVLGWMRVRVLGGAPREGFLPLHALEPAAPPGPDIDQDQFFVAATLAARVFGTDNQYLYALAAAQSGVKNAASSVAGSDAFGPFQFSVARWADLVARFGAEENITADDRSDPFDQVVLAARYSRTLADALKTALGRDPALTELYLAHLLGEDGGRAVLTASPATPVDTALQTKLDAASVRKLVADNPQILQQGGRAATLSEALDAAAAALRPGLNEAASLDARLNPQGAAVIPGELNFSSIAASKRAMAQKIVDAFANAGFDTIRQATAVATAIKESGLNPTIPNVTTKEHSVGLFQLNMKGGRGAGHSEAELQNADTNIGIVIAAARDPHDPFGRDLARANTLEEVVQAFVVDFENPANKPQEISDVLRLARPLLA